LFYPLLFCGIDSHYPYFIIIMKAAVFLTGLLASVTLAQPHGSGHGHAHGRVNRRRPHPHLDAGAQHDKRAVKTKWIVETVYETVTEVVDEHTTETIWPKTRPPKAAAATPTPSKAASQIFEGASRPPSPPAQTNVPAAPVVPVVAPAAPAPAPSPPPAAPVVASPPAAAPQVQVAQPAEVAAPNSHMGDLTFFKVGLGACGHNDAGKDQSDYIVALSAQLMGERSNDNPYCGRTITVSYGGKTVVATVRDKCMDCAYDNIDGTEKLFTEFFPLSAGRQKVQWWFN